MATVYSLICFGGRSGKTSTMIIASPCVVSLTDHGLEAGTGVVFTTTGALPTGVTSGTTYYAKSTGANTFNLYDTAANAIAGGTTGRVNTSGSQSGTHTIKSAYFVGLTSGQLSRYGASGSERIYDGIGSWYSARVGAVSALDEEVCEIGMAWTDYMTSFNPALASAVTRIETKVNGVRSSGFHAGVIGAGYKLEQTNAGASTNFKLGANRTYVDGWTVVLPNGFYGSCPGIDTSAASLCKVLNMIVKPVSTTNGTGGIAGAGFNEIYNCLCIGQGQGFGFGAYATAIVGNCIATKCGVGFSAVSYAPTSIWAYNNISVGNTTNWSTGYSGMQTSTNNAGLSGEAWIGTGGSKVTIATTDFANWGTSSIAATDDFYPASASSPQTDTAIDFYGMPAYDLAGDVRPSYENGTTTYSDMGCYEFDHGYGPWPASTTVTFVGVPASSEIRVYDSGGTELAGVETSSADHALTWAVASGVQRIVIINMAYKIKEFNYTNQSGAQILPVQMDEDDWYSNPA